MDNNPTTSLAADNLTTGDAAITIATTTGDITLDTQASNRDIIFKGTDEGVDITPLQLDMSEGGKAIFSGVTIADNTISSRSSNADLELDAAGTGQVVANAAVKFNDALGVALYGTPRDHVKCALWTGLDYNVYDSAQSLTTVVTTVLCVLLCRGRSGALLLAISSLTSVATTLAYLCNALLGSPELWRVSDGAPSPVPHAPLPHHAQPPAARIFRPAQLSPSPPSPVCR